MTGDRWHAVSDDGLRVFFTEQETADYLQLYVREIPEQPQSALGLPRRMHRIPGEACTVEVSASQRTTADSHGPQAAEYLGGRAWMAQRCSSTAARQLTKTRTPAKKTTRRTSTSNDLKSGVLTDSTVDTPTRAISKGAGRARHGHGRQARLTISSIMWPMGSSHPAPLPGAAQRATLCAHYNGTPGFGATLAGDGRIHRRCSSPHSEGGDRRDCSAGGCWEWSWWSGGQ